MNRIDIAANRDRILYNDIQKGLIAVGHGKTPVFESALRLIHIFDETNNTINYIVTKEQESTKKEERRIGTDDLFVVNRFRLSFAQYNTDSPSLLKPHTALTDASLPISAPKKYDHFNAILQSGRLNITVGTIQVVRDFPLERGYHRPNEEDEFTPNQGMVAMDPYVFIGQNNTTEISVKIPDTKGLDFNTEDATGKVKTAMILDLYGYDIFNGHSNVKIEQSIKNSMRGLLG